MELFLRLIQFVVLIANSIVYPILVAFKRKTKVIPPIANKILTLSIVELLHRIKLRKLSSKDLVQIYIDRIREVNPYINAVVEHRFEEALIDAENIDTLISKYSVAESEFLFRIYPLLGIPFTVKEACGVKGMSHVIGSLYRKHKKCQGNSKPVEKLCLAGAIPLLVSANPEYCFSIETHTFTNGRCFNPYNFTRTCGGSSGGEGALNGCGASLFGIGSDIAGSIRIPSLFNGVFGHKPTGGLIHNNEHFPNSDDPNCCNYLQMGPITRFGGDLTLLLQIIVGPDANELNLLAPTDIRAIKIFYSLGFDGLNGYLHQKVSHGIRLSIMRAVRHFEEKDVTVNRVSIYRLRNSTEIALSGIARLRNFPYLINAANRPPTVSANLMELFKSLLGYSKYTKEALIFELVRSTNAFMGAANIEKYECERRLLKQEIIELLGSDGVLFFPTFHVPAIHHNTSFLPLWGIDYCLIFNLLGLPCTHIPMGLDDRGLPIGFQVVAAPMRDKLCLQIARELEEAFGGWKPPVKHNFR